MSSGLFFCRQA